VTVVGHTAIPGLSIARVAHTTVLAYGWRRAAIAFAGGAASVLMLAPFDLWPLGFLTFPFLVWLLDGAVAGRFGAIVTAGVIGWWFGFGYFLAGLYWIGNAMLVDAATFGWLLPFAILLPPAGLALFTAFGLAARCASSRSPSD
jgi:apolipoprotein N-acyltransferase